VFEGFVSDAGLMLVFLFWLMLAFLIIWGALWVRSYKKSK
jgi:hypothetical protein